MYALLNRRVMYALLNRRVMYALLNSLSTAELFLAPVSQAIDFKKERILEKNKRLLNSLL